MYKGLVVFLFVIAVDQSSKFWAEKFFPITLNTGISFGYLASFNPLFVSILLAVFLGCLYLVGRTFWGKYPLATALFFGGVVANLIDRVLFGGVRDWLPVPFLHLQNNLADWSIFIGLVYAGIVTL